MQVEVILRATLAFPSSHIVVTGGEPLLYSEIVEVSDQLTMAGRQVTIETAGTVWQPVCCALMSISPKLLNSAPSATAYPRWHDRHQQRRDQPAVLRKLVEANPYQIKFVVAEPADIDEIESHLKRHSFIDRKYVHLMPEGTNALRLAAVSAWLEPLCLQHGLLFCPRKHIEWFGHTRGT